MSRRRAAEVRKLIPDAKYSSIIVAKFINSMMWGGKKSTAERFFYPALAEAAKKLGVVDIELFEQVVANVRPKLEVRSRRVGGATYQVPVDVSPRRSLTLAIRWIINAARNRKGQSIAQKLSSEFMDAYKGVGAAVKKREDTHKMADSNRAYAHLRM